MSELVSYERRGAVAVVMVNNPPVNALAQGVRQGLKEGVEAGNNDAEVKAIVVIGGGRTFPAGADITEFGKPMAEPGLGAVIDSMEMSDKPVIAAIHGTALGGGLEICLGCHFRVAAPTAQVGLPEVNLGILPGAGGTQRTPRLVGAEAALQMITSGSFVKALKARDMGLIDEIVEGDLLDGAVAYAETVIAEGRPIRRTRDLTVEADPALFENFEKGIARKARGFLAPFACIEAVRNSTTMPFDEGISSSRRGSWARYEFQFSFCTRLMDSKPPPTTIGMSSSTICFAAVAIAIRPEEHCRSIDMPATLTGRPPASAHCRAVLVPWLPCCIAAPMTTSSTSSGSTPARRTASAMAWPPRVGASVLLNAPR